MPRRSPDAAVFHLRRTAARMTARAGNNIDTASG
jgi:hypothetical protein